MSYSDSVSYSLELDMRVGMIFSATDGIPSINNYYIRRANGAKPYLKPHVHRFRASVERQFKAAVSALPQPCEIPLAAARVEVDMRVDLFFPDARKRDVDNFLKAVLDSLRGYFYDDDSQIASLTVTKAVDRSRAAPAFRVTLQSPPPPPPLTLAICPDEAMGCIFYENAAPARAAAEGEGAPGRNKDAGKKRKRPPPSPHDQ